MRPPFEQERGRSEAQCWIPDPPAGRSLCAASVMRAVRSFAMPFAILNYDSAQTREDAVATTARWRIPGGVEVGPRRRRGVTTIFPTRLNGLQPRTGMTGGRSENSRAWRRDHDCKVRSDNH
jgi:hypothetical protein